MDRKKSTITDTFTDTLPMPAPPAVLVAGAAPGDRLWRLGAADAIGAIDAIDAWAGKNTNGMIREIAADLEMPDPDGGPRPARRINAHDPTLTAPPA
jgi:hypothetical protein